MIYKIILFAPLIGAIIAGFGWRVTGDKGAQWLTTGLLFLAALLSWVVFLQGAHEAQALHILDWVTRISARPRAIGRAFSRICRSLPSRC
jgi:NADH-quinone oxidoreductase subunit L